MSHNTSAIEFIEKRERERERNENLIPKISYTQKASVKE